MQEMLFNSSLIDNQYGSHHMFSPERKESDQSEHNHYSQAVG